MQTKQKSQVEESESLKFKARIERQSKKRKKKESTFKYLEILRAATILMSTANVFSNLVDEGREISFNI